MFINLAIKKEVHSGNPYSKFQIAKEQTDRIFLTSEELRHLLSMYRDCTLNPAQQDVLQYFLFSCFTGLRISDIHNISHQDIIDGKLVFVPIKTKSKGKLVKIDLNNTARSLISSQSGKLFNTICDQAVNRELKKIAKIAGIRKHITYHTARHTFGAQFLVSGGKIEVLRELMGHSKIETTMAYVHLVDESKKEQVFNMDRGFELNDSYQQKG